MNILAACLCDSAADYQGKLCILGAFDTIIAPRFPATHTNCALALRFVLRAGDEGAHRILVTLSDPDGRNVLPGGGANVTLNFAGVPAATHFASSNCVISLQGLVLPAAGAYSFDVYWDGEVAIRVPLQVLANA